VSSRRAIAAPLAALAGVLALLLAAATPGMAAEAAPAVATAAAGRDPGPWATVNICDTVGHPDGIGIRGAMPGTGDRGDELFMRLQVQFLRRADGTWRDVGRAADSGFVDVGNGAARVRQAGRTFTFSPPGSGQPAFLLRGVVTFEWRHGGEVLRRARRLTTAGREDAIGADPAGFSAATCSIR
jgi:hypothetical protein